MADFTDILRELRIPFVPGGSHRHVSSGWLGLDCPQCSPNSGKFKLGYNLRGGYLSCWTCGFQNLIGTLNVLGRASSYDEVKKLLQTVDLPEWTGGDKEHTQRGVLKLPASIEPLLPQHRSYLRRRGFDPAYLETFWGVQSIGLSSKLSWRLFIPIHLHGRVVTWTTRLGGSGPVRYFSAEPGEEECHHKSLLFGEDHVRHSVVVCEGPFDVFRVGPGAVATFGTVVTRAQLLRLSKYPERAVMFDAEGGAQKAAEKLCVDLSAFPGHTYRIVLESGKDAAEAKEKEIKELRKRFLE